MWRPFAAKGVGTSPGREGRRGYASVPARGIKWAAPPERCSQTPGVSTRLYRVVTAAASKEGDGC